ncbi:MAG: phosphohistidine phosphatase SixA [Nitrospirales bacterium]|nr:MAG: phosphohistidine phosphatase SixA [Nitrospirales bacterium]
MKTLYLVRHAEASAQSLSGGDLSRQLSLQGEKEAVLMGQRLSQRLKPEVMISSHALRAKTTAQILATKLDYPEADILFEECLYEAEPDDLLSVINAVDNKIVCLMLVGHNPALTQFVKAFAQGDIPNMPPCSIAVLQSTTESWHDLACGNTELLDFDYPKKMHE